MEFNLNKLNIFNSKFYSSKVKRILNIIIVFGNKGLAVWLALKKQDADKLENTEPRSV